jgi:cytochrome c biogenesis protein CcmG/thiol:disulfide interchange protein DsbE
VLVPIAAFILLAILFYRGLFGNPSEIPSVLIDKPVPEFVLPAVECAPCRSEHPLLMMLAQRTDIRLYGINQKDEPENARRFLGSLGNPFVAIGADRSGRVAIDWGVYGVPETFIVDGRGVIRLNWIGPLTPAAIRDTIDPKIAELAKP